MSATERGCQSLRCAKHRTLAAAAAVNLALGTLFGWSILLLPLEAEFGESPGALSPIFSASLIFFAAAVLAAGHLTDRHSPRLLAAVAGITAGLGLTVSAVAPSPTVLGAGFGVLFGLASGLGYVTVVTVASTRFGVRRGLALGVVVGAYAAGPIIVGPLGWLSIEALGWRPTLGLLAIVVTAVTLAASGGLPRHPAATDGTSSSPPGEPHGSSAALGMWSLWTLFLLATAPGLLAFAYTTDIMVERDMSVTVASAVVAAMATGNLVGRLVAGPMSDWLGVRATMRVALIVLALALAALGWLPGGVVAAVALLAIGIEYGAISTLLPAATNELVGPARFGAAYGRVFSAWGVAGALGPTAGAWLHDLSDSYTPVFRLSLLAAALAWVALATFERATRACAEA